MTAVEVLNEGAFRQNTSKIACIDAEYQDQFIEEYEGNPLIEALPPIMSRQESLKLMSKFPKYPQKDLALPPEFRGHCINRLKSLVYPLPEALTLESTFSSMLRFGYVSQNPLDASNWRFRYQLAESKKYDDVKRENESTASALLATGISGMGKTTMAKSILNLYPRVIRHKKYRGTEINIIQIPWVKISIPKDGLLSGLCHAFFMAIDGLLGTNFLQQYVGKNISIDTKLLGMERIASNYFVGAIVIDEFQNLNLAKAGGAQIVLSYLRHIIDNVGVPLVIIGTPSVGGLFMHGLQDARRVSESGLIEIMRPEAGSRQWEGFMDVLQQYIWLPGNEAKLSTPLREVLYDLSQGVTDLSVRLLMLAQKLALEEGKNILTVSLIKRASDRHFKLILPAIDALKSGDPKKMLLYDDLMSLELKLESDRDSMRILTPAPVSPLNSDSEQIVPTMPNVQEKFSSNGLEKVLKKKKPPVATISQDDVQVPDGLISDLGSHTSYEALQSQGLIGSVLDGNCQAINRSPFPGKF